MRLYFVLLPVCTVATAVKARCASVAFDFWVRSESLCAIITRADGSLAAVYCDIYKEMNHPGRRAGSTVFPVQSRYSATIYATMYTNLCTVLEWVEDTNFWEELWTFLLLSLEYFFLRWETVQNAFFFKRFSPYMGRLTTKPPSLSPCSSSSSLAFL